MSIRLLVADDHELVRSGLVSLLKNTDIEIVGEAATADEVIEKTGECNPDVVLLDIRLRDSVGLTAREDLQKKNPGTRVIMLSTYENPTYVVCAFAFGACVFVLFGASCVVLVG